MRAGCAVTRRVEHGFENGVKDVDTHGGAVGVLQDRLMMITVKFVARLRNKKKYRDLENLKISFI